MPGGGFYDMVEKQLSILGKELNENLVYTSLLNGNRVILFNYNSTHPVKVDDTAMYSDEFYSYTTGRILAAFSSADTLAEIIEQHGFPGFLIYCGRIFNGYKQLAVFPLFDGETAYFD